MPRSPHHLDSATARHLATVRACPAELELYRYLFASDPPRVSASAEPCDWREVPGSPGAVVGVNCENRQVPASEAKWAARRRSKWSAVADPTPAELAMRKAAVIAARKRVA